jgi:hypothetical protein
MRRKEARRLENSTVTPEVSTAQTDRAEIAGVPITLPARRKACWERDKRQELMRVTDDGRKRKHVAERGSMRMSDVGVD